MTDKESEQQQQPFTYSLQQAQKHRRATSFGKPLVTTEKCSCCNRAVEKESLDWCFNQTQLFYSGIQYSSYLILVKFVLFQLLILGLVFSLPLLLINYKSNACLTMIACGDNFLYSFSFFNSFSSQQNLNMIFYLAIPAIFLSIVLFIFKTRSLCLMRIKQQQLGLFPESFALFLQLPFNHLTEAFVIGQIDAWWQSEAKKNKQHFVTQFDQLADQRCKEGNLFSDSSQPVDRIQSRVVHEVIFSYNYPEFQALRNEIEVFTRYFQAQALVNKEQMFAMINLHQKKKKMLQQTAKNKFCLIIFKSPKYAHYFYKKTHSTLFQKMFCYQKKRDFQIEEEDVEVERGHFPAELNWQHMHLTSKQKIKNRILGYILFVVLFGGSTAGWYGVYILHTNLITSNSQSLSYFPIVVAAIVNILIVLVNRLNKWINSRQQRATYSDQGFSFILRTCLINVNLLYLSPFVVYSVNNYSFLWSNNGLLLVIYYSVGMYAAASIILKYLNFQSLAYCYNQLAMDQTQPLTQKQANQKYQKPTFQLWQNITHLLTMLLLTCLTIPLNPLILAISLIWAVIFYFTQKINISSFCKQGQYHGQNLILAVSYVSQFSLFLFVAACLSAALIASASGVFSLNTMVICVLSLLTFASLVYLFLPIQQFFDGTCKIKQAEYYELKSKFIQLYQKYNNPYLYGLKEKGRSTGQQYSVRLKIFEEMNTMSKTLTQSLKERLLAYQTPVLNNDKKKQGSENQVDNIYFEYEKKVHMKNSIPKVQIPRLFRAQTHDWRNSVEMSELDRVNINSLFSSEDESNKRLVKKIIKQKVKQEGKIQ